MSGSDRGYSWSTPVRYIVLMGLIALGIWFAVISIDLIAALTIGALIAFILNPFVDFLVQRSHLPHTLVVVLVFLFFLISVALGLVLVVPPLVREVTSLWQELQVIQTELETTLADRTYTFFFVEFRVSELLQSVRGDTIELLQPDRAFRLVRGASTNLAWTTISLVTTFYLLRDWSRLRDWLLALFPAGARPDVWRLYLELRAIWRGYLRGQLVLMFIVGTLTTVSLAAIGFRGAVALGILAGAMDFIPTVGPTVVTILATVVAWFEGPTFLPMSNVAFALLVMGVYTLVQVVENIWLRPQVMRYALRLHPGLVIIGVIASLLLAGVLVTLLIVPLIGSALAIGRYLHARLLDLPPWPAEVAAAESVETAGSPAPATVDADQTPGSLETEGVSAFDPASRQRESVIAD